MNKLNQALAAAAFLLAGCNVSVNNQSVENQADSLGDQLENVAESAGNSVDRAAGQVENAVGNGADALGNVNLNVDVHADGNKADGNSD
jgi:hypothetical protein